MQLIEYKGKMLAIGAISKKENLHPITLKKYYIKTGNIYEAVRIAKESSRGEIELIEYYDELLPLGTIAKKENVYAITLKKYYVETGDIYKAVQISKQVAKHKIQYNGEMLSLAQIAQKEDINENILRKNYDEVGDIYMAVKLSERKPTNKIEYNGELLTIHAISKKEQIDLKSLKKCYEETGDIYTAVEMSRPNKRILIEYYGENITINAIAQREKLVNQTLKRQYEITGDIYLAVKICKENTLKRKTNMIKYKDEYLELGDIAKREKVASETLKECYSLVQEIYRAVYMAKHLKINRQKIELTNQTYDIYDISLLIGIDNDIFINLILSGMNLNEIKEQYLNLHKTENEKYNKRTRSFKNCSEHKLNFTFMHRAETTYAKTLEEANEVFTNNHGKIPTQWILEKYDSILKKLSLSKDYKIQIAEYLRNERLSLEEALKKCILIKKAKQYNFNEIWGELVYSIAKTRENYKPQFESEIQLTSKEEKFIKEVEEKILELMGQITGNIGKNQHDDLSYEI